MIKQVKDLTHEEIEFICAKNGENNKTEIPRNACKDCKLRWCNQCMLCVGMIQNSVYSRMVKAIGDKKVELGLENNKCDTK